MGQTGRRSIATHILAVKIDRAQKNQSFFCNERVLDDKKSAEPGIIGVGWVTFHADNTGRFTSGDGFFVDTGTVFEKCNQARAHRERKGQEDPREAIY
jgi:hypothetical protein